MNMQAHEALQKHMESLVRQNERLLALVEERREAMMGRDVLAIERLLAEEQKLGMAIYEEERRRRQAVVNMGPSLGRSTPEMLRMSLAEVAEFVEEPRRTRLLELKQRLGRVTEQVQRTNLTLQQLSQRLLPCFEELLGVLVGGQMGGPSYTSGGKASRGFAADMNMVDVRI